VQLGFKYFFQRDFKTAIRRFNQAWLLDPQNGGAFHGFALVVLERDGDTATSESLFREALNRPRKSPDIYVDFGRFLLRQGRPAEAVDLLRQASSLSNAHPDVQALIAIGLYETGNFPAACAEARKVGPKAQDQVRDSIKSLLDSDHCRPTR
jgi:Tfp pilus assembly protein PilF